MNGIPATVLLMAFAALLGLGCNSESTPATPAVRSHIRVFTPEGSGPFPTIVAVPGCSGVSYETATDAGGGLVGDPEFRRHYPRMARRLRDRGFLVFLVDYLTAHGVVNACNGEISFAEVGRYVQAAAQVASEYPSVDRARFFLLGWSRGGGGVLAALAESRTPAILLAGTIAVYPGCEELLPWERGQRVLMLLAELDDIAPPDVCRGLVAGVADEQNIGVRGYAGARHGFDVPELASVVELGGGFTLGFDSVAAADAWRDIVDWLAQ